jgi:ABC-type molybdate transport system permease subunit
MIDTHVIGSQGNMLKVTPDGVVVVGDEFPSTWYLGSTASNNVAVNVVPPVTGKEFIITAMILSADRSVGANGAVTDIFENGTGPTDGTVTKQIIQEEIAKQTRAVITPVYIKVTQGRWVNVKSDDVIVRCNIAGYYRDAQ